VGEGEDRGSAPSERDRNSRKKILMHRKTYAGEGENSTDGNFLPGDIGERGGAGGTRPAGIYAGKKRSGHDREPCPTHSPSLTVKPFKGDSETEKPDEGMLIIRKDRRTQGEGGHERMSGA